MSTLRSTIACFNVRYGERTSEEAIAIFRERGLQRTLAIEYLRNTRRCAPLKGLEKPRCLDSDLFDRVGAAHSQGEHVKKAHEFMVASRERIRKREAAAGSN